MRVSPAWWWEIFFAALEAKGNVTKAAAAAGRRRAEVYEIASLSTEFAIRWKQALLAYDVAKLERDEAERRRRLARARWNFGLRV